MRIIIPIQHVGPPPPDPYPPPAPPEKPAPLKRPWDEPPSHRIKIKSVINKISFILFQYKSYRFVSDNGALTFQPENKVFRGDIPSNI